MTERRYKMHWWFFFSSLVPWVFAIAFVLILGVIAGLNPVSLELYDRFRNVFIVIVLAGAVLSGLATTVKWIFTTLTVGEGHIVYEKGILNRTVAKVPVQEIASIDLRQTLFQRMLNTGDLVIDMRGVSLMQLNLLSRPSEIQDKVLAMREK